MSKKYDPTSKPPEPGTDPSEFENTQTWPVDTSNHLSESGQTTDSDDQSASRFPTVTQMSSWVVKQPLDPMNLPSGEAFGDFFVWRELGRGSFGVVYLAEQISLKRPVALKVTDVTREDGCSVEGQTMAQLEHPSIVRVYSQTVDTAKKRRILCMQYVPGMDLRSLMATVRAIHGHDWDGSCLLDVLDKQAEPVHGAVLESNWRDRDHVEKANRMATLCWFGAEIAEALDHAHRAGYIHGDVKPANTIVNVFGRPMLVDFNMAVDVGSMKQSGLKGGTVPFMSPEAIRAVVSDEPPELDDLVNADLYALGVTLWNLASSEFPYASQSFAHLRESGQAHALIEARKVVAQSDRIEPELRECLQLAISPDRSKRFDSGLAFAESLRGVTRQADVLSYREPKNLVGRLALRYPIAVMLIAGFVPHIVASIFQIAYNEAEIVSRLNEQALDLFHKLIGWVNPIAYSMCGYAVVRQSLQTLKSWRAKKRGAEYDENDLEKARRKLLTLPRYFAIVGGLGWLFGAVAFPVMIYFVAQQFSIEVWLHFWLSFLLCGAIAVTGSYALTLAAAVYAIYPTMFATPRNYAGKSAEELGPIRSRWAMLSKLMGLIPLASVILLVGFFRPEDLLTDSTHSVQEVAFKGLVIGLIGASVLGFEMVRRIGLTIVHLIERCAD